MRFLAGWCRARPSAVLLRVPFRPSKTQRRLEAGVPRVIIGDAGGAHIYPVPPLPDQHAAAYLGKVGV
jgi:hypothetical protein